MHRGRVPQCRGKKHLPGKAEISGIISQVHQNWISLQQAQSEVFEIKQRKCAKWTRKGKEPMKTHCCNCPVFDCRFFFLLSINSGTITCCLNHWTDSDPCNSLLTLILSHTVVWASETLQTSPSIFLFNWNSVAIQWCECRVSQSRLSSLFTLCSFNCISTHSHTQFSELPTQGYVFHVCILTVHFKPSGVMETCLMHFTLTFWKMTNMLVSLQIFCGCGYECCSGHSWDRNQE